MMHALKLSGELLSSRLASKEKQNNFFFHFMLWKKKKYQKKIVIFRPPHNIDALFDWKKVQYLSFSFQQSILI